MWFPDFCTDDFLLAEILLSWVEFSRSWFSSCCSEVLSYFVLFLIIMFSIVFMMLSIPLIWTQRSSFSPQKSNYFDQYLHQLFLFLKFTYPLNKKILCWTNMTLENSRCVSVCRYVCVYMYVFNLKNNLFVFFFFRIYMYYVNMYFFSLCVGWGLLKICEFSIKILS